MSNTLVVGISDLQTYAPILRVNAEELAMARGRKRDSFTRNLGVETFAVPNTDEDAATMAANAIIKIVDRNGIDPHKVKLKFATESAIDDSKPTITFVYDALEMYYGKTFNYALPVEHKFACVAGLDALGDALCAAVATGERTIVVTTDHAKYPLNSPGEATSGSGATATLVEPNPRLIAIDPMMMKEYTINEYDFYKPKFPNADGSKIIGSDMPLYDGKHSNLVYDYIYYKVYRQIEEELGRSLLDEVRHIAVHLPYKSKIQDPFADVVRHNLKNYHPEEWQETLKELAGMNLPFTGEPLMPGSGNLHESEEIILTYRRAKTKLTREDSEIVRGANHDRQSLKHDLEVLESRLGMGWTHRELTEIVRDFDRYSNKEINAALAGFGEEVVSFGERRTAFVRAMQETSHYKAEFARKAANSQATSGFIGNTYTGAVFFSIQSTLTSDYSKSGAQIIGEKMLILGFGSGAGGKGMLGTIQDGVVEYANSTDMSFVLNGTPISVGTFEKLHRGELREPVPEIGNPGKKVFLTAVYRDGKRNYGVTEPEKLRVRT